MTHLGPTAPPDRALALDVLRGAALFGVLLVNMQFHRGPAIHRLGTGVSEPGRTAPDEVADFVIAWLGQGKAYAILAFLFGYGAHLHWRRAQAAGVRFGPSFSRRLVGLLVLGVLHAVLLFFGDILVLYALAGTTLLLAVRWSDRTLTAWAIGLVIAETLLLTAVAFVELTPREVAAYLDDADRAAAAYTGGVGETVAQRVRELILVAPGLLVSLPQAVAMVFVGVLCARRRLLEAPREHARFLRRAVVLGLAFGLPLNLAAALVAGDAVGVDGAGDALGVAGVVLGPYVLAAGYVGAIALLAGRLRVLAPLGRVSLTAYLLQSVIAAFLFTSYGLELYGDVGPAAGVGVTLAVFAAEVLFARWWLRSHRIGPVERGLRRLTYGRSAA